MPDLTSASADDPGVRSDAVPSWWVTIERWGAALADHNDVEVERLVKQSRINRAWAVSSEQLGAAAMDGPSWRLLHPPQHGVGSYPVRATEP